MAKVPRGFARKLFRVLWLGLLFTFIFTIYWGICILREKDGPSLQCTCPMNEVQGNEGDNSEHSLCIIIPFRNRFEELLEFAPHIHEFLKKQDIKHKIVVVNQLDKYRFNRASLINVGFLETRSSCDYIAMHDVDLLPLNDELRYNFPEEGPYHLSAPHLHPMYHYKTFVGGILLIQSKHFEMLNGLSNKYWGWGREDDEFFVRLRKAKFSLTRPGNLTTGYKSFKHLHDRRKRPRDYDKFFDQREKTRKLDKETGVSNVKYAVDSVKLMTIDGAPLTLLNTFLECDVDFTPWCLQAEDHEWYRRRLEQQSNSPTTGSPQNQELLGPTPKHPEQ
ncbi:beta-1,4-galactosyltransferase 7-like [Physella acuta]|uniref:beta-1,4-galactosyltransferase 7-like n=1 Tax=Physella acuta TaxID=109671 RepID=UPI0027DB4EB0|nr:beta-1,4-galactosyltransferase 7-like [Physella acuta]XP_059151193.1 beta-1,4-galactosyltransferase 7-like [Physella acuta]